MEKSDEAMLPTEKGEKSKIERLPLDADWLSRDYTKGGKTAYWADEEETPTKKIDLGMKRRDYWSATGHLILALIIIAEVVLWIQVMHKWRYSPVNSNLFIILLPVFMPSIANPLLAIVHSLTRGKLSFKLGLLLMIPPSPALLHLILVYRALARVDKQRKARIVRIAGIVQACVMSFPLLLVSMNTLIMSMLQNNSVDAGLFHRHVYENKLQFAASTISFLNLIITAYRYNERLTSRPVAILVGFPFIFSNILFRIICFSLLFSLFEPMWIVLCLGILFGMSAISVQLSSNYTICGRLFRAVFGDNSVDDEKRCSIFNSLLLSIGGVILPVGYASDTKLGHVTGRGWRLILVNAIGAVAILCTVVSTAIVQYVPNSFSVKALVSTFLAMNEMEITLKTGGKEISVAMPKHQIQVIADGPAQATFSVSHHDDIIMSYLIPAILCLLVLPFTILRIILIGWDCRMERQLLSVEEEIDSYQINSRQNKRYATAGRSCCAVLWSISSLMAFTSLITLTMTVYVFSSVLTHIEPLDMGR